MECWMRLIMEKIIPTLVVAPQNPGGAWSPNKLNDLLEWMKSHYRWIVPEFMFWA